VSKELDALRLFPSEYDNDIDIKKATSGIDVDDKAELYWNKSLKIIKDNVSKQVYKTWFQPLKPLKWNNDVLTVKVPSQFFCEWIEEHFYPLLQKTVSQVMGPKAKLQYQVVVEKDIDPDEDRTIKLPGLKQAPQNNQPALTFSGNQEKPPTFSTYLNGRYTFDNFIQGESNQLAVSAGKAIAQNPGGTRFNPLVIYGGTGLGKTHLVQAIGNQIISKSRRSRVLYTTSERFTMEYVNSIQNNKLNDFINYYRGIDALIVDDIQFFGGKEKTQDNFFHTFNALHQEGKQLVLTSDKPPRDLKDVDERLMSRFQWGLIVDIQPPDFEMRMAILQKKSEDEGIELPLDVVEYLARSITKSIRELEGALISLIAKVTLDRKSLTLALAKEVISGIRCSDPKPITIEDIKEEVSHYYKISLEVIESKSRKHEITLARQMAMYLAKKMTPHSLKTIGSYFGNRDHSTVLHSCQAIENYLVTDNSVRIAFEMLSKQLDGSNS
jgi:chromosomal replication initiator protein